MNGLRVVGISTVLLLAVWGWRHRRTAAEAFVDDSSAGGPPIDATATAPRRPA